MAVTPLNAANLNNLTKSDWTDGRPAIYDVVAYGAVGDNVANDTTAIQNAINACTAAGGGIVWLPPGTYKCTSTVFVKTGVSIFGAGMGSCSLKFPSDFGTTARALNKNVPSLDAYTNTGTQAGTSHFRDFSVVGPTSAQTPGVRAVLMDGVLAGGNTTWQNVQVTGFGGGMVVGGDHTVHIGCFYQGNYYSCLHPSPAVTQGNNDFFHCKFGGSGFAAIAVGGDTILDYHRYVGCEAINSPYGFYKGDTTSNTGVVTPSGLGLMNGCLVAGFNFESIGNAFVLDESTGTGSGQDSMNSTTWWYPGCVWDDTYKIAARSQAYAFDVRGTEKVVIHCDVGGFPPHPTAGTAMFRALNGFNATVHLHSSLTSKVFGSGTSGARVVTPEWEGRVWASSGIVALGDLLMFDTANASTVLRNSGTASNAAQVFAGVAGLAPVAGSNLVAVAEPGSLVAFTTDLGTAAGRYVVPDATNHHGTTGAPTGKKVVGICTIGGSFPTMKVLDGGWNSP